VADFYRWKKLVFGEFCYIFYTFVRLRLYVSSPEWFYGQTSWQALACCIIVTSVCSEGKDYVTRRD
jgi:hypothetical protein